MKLDIKDWTNIISGSLVVFFSLVLYFDTKIIIKNKYEETNNKLYLFLLFIVMILHSKYRL